MVRAIFDPSRKAGRQWRTPTQAEAARDPSLLDPAQDHRPMEERLAELSPEAREELNFLLAPDIIGIHADRTERRRRAEAAAQAAAEKAYRDTLTRQLGEAMAEQEKENQI